MRASVDLTIFSECVEVKVFISPSSKDRELGDWFKEFFADGWRVCSVCTLCIFHFSQEEEKKENKGRLYLFKTKNKNNNIS